MARVLPGTYGGRLLTQGQFTAFGGAFQPGRLFRISVTGNALSSTEGLAVKTAEGDILHFAELPLGQLQFAGEALVCSEILVNDGETPPKATAFGTATLEIGYVNADGWIVRPHTKA